VRQWGVAHGYAFNYGGDMGSMYSQSGASRHGPDEPVTRICWHDTDRSADGYRLPSSCERLWAAFGTNGTPYPWGSDWSDAHAWKLENSGGSTQPAATKAPDRLGLYDLIGNAEEICDGLGEIEDWRCTRNPGWTPACHIGVTGGSAWHPASRGAASFGRAFARIKDMQAYPNIGFRVVRCPHQPALAVSNRVYAVTGPHTNTVRALAGKRVRHAGIVDEAARTIAVASVAASADGASLACLANPHPPGGERNDGFVLLDIAEGAPADPLQGAVFRANLQRTGEFKASGVPALHGLRWSFRTGGPVWSSPVAVGGTVFVGSFDGNLYAIDEATGGERWRFATGGRIYSSPAVAHGLVYFGSADGSLYAVDAATGAMRWKVAGENRAGDWTNGVTLSQIDVAGSPAVAYGLVFVSQRGRMRGFDARTGRERWANLGFGGGQELGSPAIAGGLIAYGSMHTRLNVFSLRDARLRLACTEVGNDSQTSSPALLDGKLCHVGLQAVVYVHDLAARRMEQAILPGRSIGRAKNSAHDGQYMPGYRVRLSSAAVKDGTAVVGTVGGALCAVDLASGKDRWVTTLGRAVRSSPGIAGDLVYVGCDDGNLYAVGLPDGAIRWKQATDGPIVSSPYIGDAVVYVGSDDGRVYAIE
jgi:outer membrane protein assembly factor BamB